MKTLTVKIAEIQEQALGIKSFKFVPCDGETLPSFSAGSHIDVHINSFVRQYSLCNYSEAPEYYLIAVKKEPLSRGGSKGMHESLKVNDKITISEPKNHFQLHKAPRHLLIGAGIGITPLIAMAKELMSRNELFEMHYFTRSKEHTAFYSSLSKLSENVYFHFEVSPDRLPQRLESILMNTHEQAHLYHCGPAPFMELVNKLGEKMFPAEQIHFEYFSAPQEKSIEGDKSFIVKLAKCGREFTVPEDKSLIETLQEQGVDIPMSCEQGICGTCLTNVVDGKIDHRDMFLSDAEKAKNDQMLPCISRALGEKITIDI